MALDDAWNDSPSQRDIDEVSRLGDLARGIGHKPHAATQEAPAPRWTFACTRCEWTGNSPNSVAFGLGVSNYADCPDCGNSCTTDEPSFEPEAGQLDGNNC